MKSGWILFFLVIPLIIWKQNPPRLLSLELVTSLETVLKKKKEVYRLEERST